MSKRLLIALLALLFAAPAAAQDMTYVGDPPDAESFATVPSPGPGQPAGTPYPVFQPNERLFAAQLNAALAAPTIIGGSINGAPIGLSNQQEGRFSVLRSIGAFSQDSGAAVFAGSGNFQVGDNSTMKRAVFNSYYTPTGGAMIPAFLAQGNAFGTITSATTVATLRGFNLNSDSINATGAQGGGLHANYFGHTISSGATGGRNTLSIFQNHVGPSAAAAGFYVALAAFTQSSGSAGGTISQDAGKLFGANISSLLKTGSGVYWNSVVGTEINVGTQTGTAVLDKIGLQVVQWSSDAVAASRSEIGLLFTAQTQAQVIGWKQGIAFGAAHGSWPMHPSGTLIGIGDQNKSLPARYPVVVANGIDLAGVKFTTASLALPGLLVDGTGQATIGSNTIGWSGAGLSLGAAGKVGALSAIAAGGTSYRVTDVLRDGYGGLWQVATVSSGAVTGLTLIKAPTISSGSAPSNPLLLGGGMGSSASINVTWTDAAEIALASGRLRLSYALVAGTGSTQGAAAALPNAHLIRVTVSGANIAVALPAATTGLSFRVVGAYANGSDALVFPASGELIRAGTFSYGTNGSIHLTAGGALTFECLETGIWTVTAALPA